MAAPATAAAEAGVLSSASRPHPHRYPWQEEVDDAALTGNEGADPDVTRLMAVDEEELLAAEDDDVAGMSPRQELLETLKLLASGGVAGAVSKTATAPLARLTILYQVGF